MNRLCAGVLLLIALSASGLCAEKTQDSRNEGLKRPNLKNPYADIVLAYGYRQKTIDLPWRKFPAPRREKGFDDGVLARTYGILSGCRPIVQIGRLQIAFKIILE